MTTAVATEVSLVELLEKFRGLLSYPYLDDFSFSFPFSGTLHCDVPRYSGFRIHPAASVTPFNQRSSRVTIEARGIPHGTGGQGYLEIDLFIPSRRDLDSPCDVFVPTGCKEEGNNIQIGHGTWIPFEADAAYVVDKPEGTVWNDSGALILWYKNRHWIKWR